MDARGDTKGYKKSACENIISLSETFDLEGCLNFVINKYYSNTRAVTVGGSGYDGIKVT